MGRRANLSLLWLATVAAAQTVAPTLPTAADLKHVLQTCTPADRLAVLQRVDNGGLNALQIDDELLSLLDRSAADASAPLRSESAMLIGLKWIQPDNVPPASLARAIDIEARLAEDVNAEVRHDAVAAGLKNAADKNAVVVRALVDAVMRPAEWNDAVAGQAIFGLNGACGGKVDGSLLTTLLEPYWAAHQSDPDRAAAAYVLYLGATGIDPPHVDRLDDVGRFSVAFEAHAGITADDIQTELRAKLPAHAVSAVTFQLYRGRLQGQLVISGVANRKQVVEGLRYSRCLTLFDEVSHYGGNVLTAAKYRELLADAAKPSPIAAPTTRSDYTATFQALYDYLGRTYTEFAMKQIDWPAVGRELLPLSTRVRSDAEFGLLVERLVARLQDSHAVVEPGTANHPSPTCRRGTPVSTV